MSNAFSSDPTRPIAPAAESSAAGARLALLGSWIDADSDLELVRKRALYEALGAERDRLRSEVALDEERLESFDADMYLALARDRETAARVAIQRIIAVRRRCRALWNAIARLEQERARLAAAIRLAETAPAALLDFPPTPASIPIPRLAGPSVSRVSSGTPTSRRWI